MIDYRAGLPANKASLMTARRFLVVAILVVAMMGAAGARLVLGQTYTYLTVPLFALSNTAQSIKGSPTTLLFYSCVNPNATAVYIQVYNSVGVITVGTSVPNVNFRVPPTSSTGIVPPQSTGGYYASAGLQAAATTTAGGAIAPALPVPCDFGVR